MTDNTLWRVNLSLTPHQLGEWIYGVNFPRRHLEFWKLPETVQDSYERDAVRLLQYMNAVKAQ